MPFSARIKRTYGLTVFGFLALIVIFSMQGHAQVAGATVSGTVTDPSSGAIPGTQISIINTATGISTNGTTNSSGFYSIPNLIPGPYQITIRADGFQTQIRNGITLTVGEQQVLNAVLPLGQTSQTVEVTAAAPSVELTSSSVTAEMEGSVVRELPLNGRSWSDLVTLQPATNSINTQQALASAGGGQTRANRGYGNEVSIAGARPNQSNYRLDGISMNDYANAGPGSALGGNLGVDAIAEFSVITTNYSAEYGKTSGGVVNAVSRNGTNQFHGSVYEFLRNSALDARNFFDGPQIPTFRRNQFGGSAGAPIQKDRTFVFGDFEGIRQFKGISQLNFVPSAAARGGNICSVPSGSVCTPHTVVVNPSAAAYLPLFPLPNAGAVPGANGDQGKLLIATNQTVAENFFTVRVDHRFSDKDSIFGSVMYDRTPYLVPDVFNDIVNRQFTLRQLYTIEETHVFSPSVVNVTRLGFNRMSTAANAGDFAVNPLAADPSLGITPGFPAGGVTISGGYSVYQGGLGVATNTYDHWNSYQFYDDASWTRGTHSIKFGGSVENMRLNHRAGQAQGVFNFPSLEAFLTNAPNKFTAPILGNVVAQQAFRMTVFGLYIQDDWRARKNLTVNMGLRYEPTTVFGDHYGNTSLLRNLTDATPHLGNPFYGNSTLRDFEPRVGVAWDPFGDGKTSIRSGFGLFVALPLPYLWNARQAVTAPQSISGATTNVAALKGTFYNGALGLLTPTSASAEITDPQPRESYVTQWNLTVQRQLTPSLTALVGYIGSSGVHLPVEEDTVDVVVPTLIEGRYVYPNPIGSGTKINNSFSRITGQWFQGKSNYHSLIATLTKKASHGLTFQSSFTWGKSIDDGTTTSFGDTFANSIAALDFFDLPGLVRGVSDYNVGKILAINAMWDIPSIKSLTGPAARVVNGWRLGTIFSLSDGQPFTPTFGINNDVVGNKSTVPYAFPDRLTGPGCDSLVNPGNPNNYIKKQCFSLPTAPSVAFWNANCDKTSKVFGSPATVEPFPYCFNMRGDAGRNIMEGPGIRNVDLSVYKDNPIRAISESANLQFRAEFFNVFNHPNFSPPLTSLGQSDIFTSAGAPSSVGGILTSTITTAREIQFALKFIW